MRALNRENESAKNLSDKSFHVEQNPVKLPNGNEPDYIIDGEVWDNYAPTSSNVRNIYSTLLAKVEKEQAQNVVVTLKDTNVSSEALRKKFENWPSKELKELIIIDKLNAITKIKFGG